MRQLPVTMRRSEDFDGASDPIPDVVIAVQIHGAFDHRFDCWAAPGIFGADFVYNCRNDHGQRNRLTIGSSDRGVASSVGQGGSR
jgi:hypothetical protein